MKALVIGGVSIDTILKVDYEVKEILDDMSLFASETYTTIGGTGAGKALALSTLGASVTFITCFALEDEQKILETLDQTNLNLYVHETSSTTKHTNIMHGNGNRMSVFTSMCDDDIEPYLIDFSSFDYIFLNIDGFTKHYIPYLKDLNNVVVDVHDYDEENKYYDAFLKEADYLFLSDIKIKNDEKFLKKAIKNRELVVITKGSKGYIAINKEGTIFKDTAKELTGEYKDSNGAGDSFCSGYFYEYFKTKDTAKALDFASYCGMLACTSKDLFKIK